MVVNKKIALVMLVLVLGLMVVGISVSAQEATPEVTPEAAPDVSEAMTPMRVELRADDGLTLVGDLYNAQLNVQTPAILLMHMNGGNRNDWHYFIVSLTAQGYRVLTVDLRGHGETGGSRDWQKAIGDTQLWLNWMENQPAIDADNIGIVGASIGSNLALVGCAADKHCKTVVAMSPALDYFGVTTSDAITALRQRPALIMGSRRDSPTGPDVATMAGLGVGEVDVHLFAGQQHGTALFGIDGVSDEIIAWLNGRLR
ncbi:MAG: alpha/beta fold hydrolase [Chloroflexi bacterium]|nr:alpha/beta fold hydrolase [Chloroflexota bacterium]